MTKHTHSFYKTYFIQFYRVLHFSDGLVGSPCSTRDCQESSPKPQFKSINSSALSFLYSPTLTSIQSVMPSSPLILCRPLLLLPPIPPSTRVFSSESTLHMRWPKDWSFSFSIMPSKEHPGIDK